MNLSRKALAAEEMFGNLVLEMNNAVAVSAAKNFNTPMELPKWAA